MNTRIRLLVRKIWFSDFSWEELESYLGLRKSTLIEELKMFFKNIPESAEILLKTIEKADANEKWKEFVR